MRFRLRTTPFPVSRRASLSKRRKAASISEQSTLGCSGRATSTMCELGCGRFISLFFFLLLLCSSNMYCDLTKTNKRKEAPRWVRRACSTRLHVFLCVWLPQIHRAYHTKPSHEFRSRQSEAFMTVNGFLFALPLYSTARKSQ